jgi:hypothetical protein
MPLPSTEDLENMYLKGRYDRQILVTYWINLADLFEWAIYNRIDDFPVFVEPDPSDPIWGTPKPNAAASPSRPEIEDRKRCQEIAFAKWQADPTIPIAQMARDEAIRREGNGAQYRPPTLWRWLREVAPAGVRGKRGRPVSRANSEN